MVITDLVRDEIRAHLADHEPERGGALYGPRDYPFVTHFQFDPDGQTSSVSYVPSTALIESVIRVERETGLQFKGIIHSHPPGCFQPSSGDEQTVASFFRLNPHISAMALPIVQPFGQRELRPDADFVRWYRAERKRERVRRMPTLFASRQSVFDGAMNEPAVQLQAEEYHVVPLGDHVRRICSYLAECGHKLDVTRNVQHLTVQNAELVGLVASADGGREFMYFVSIGYPVVPPFVLCQKSGETVQLQFKWNGMSDVSASLREICDRLLAAWPVMSANASLGNQSNDA